VELTFTAKGESCANTVSVPALGKTLTLKDGGKTTIRFTLKKGTTPFSCEMGMYRGQIIAK
jgi:plastocyanin domain-containing protein